MKPIQKLFSMKSMLSMEGLVDKTIKLLCEQIEKRYVDGKNAHMACDLSDWVEFCNCNCFSNPYSLAFLWQLLTRVQPHRRLGCRGRVDF